MKILFPLILALTAPSAFAGVQFNWLTNGACAEETPDGHFIQYVPFKYCEQSVGVRFAWRSNGACAEETPDGYFIQYLPSKYCENQ
jgi:hypothetical protein